MVSEDSDQFLSRLLAIHRLSNLDDSNQPFAGSMVTTFNQLNTSSKLLEIIPLRCVQRILSEEWNDHLQQFLPPSHDVPIQVFLVIVVPLVSVYLTNLEEFTQFVQACDAFRTLRNGEFVTHLIAGLVAFPAFPIWLSDKADGEAPFSVHKTSNPAKFDQPFLLIVRTQHVVTTFRW
jgi:hypothetical protein